jgi:hypothetical protein
MPLTFKPFILLLLITFGILPGLECKPVYSAKSIQELLTHNMFLSLDVSWDKKNWSNFYFGIVPTFSLNNRKEQFQIGFKGGVMRTAPPVYTSMYIATHPDVLSLHYPKSALLSLYGSIMLSCSYRITKKFGLSMSLSYITSVGTDYTYNERAFSDFNGDGDYTIEEYERSPVVYRSFEVKPEILSLGLGINYWFM